MGGQAKQARVQEYMTSRTVGGFDILDPTGVYPAPHTLHPAPHTLHPLSHFVTLSLSHTLILSHSHTHGPADVAKTDLGPGKRTKHADAWGVGLRDEYRVGQSDAYEAGLG